MTVSSLWKALDRAGCGKPVGSKDIQEHCAYTSPKQQEHINPWNFNEHRSSPSSLFESRPTLAIDLSIWICEALSSTAMAKSNADPSIYLVYTRILKLLNLGVKVVVVIEGKRRTRRPNGKDSFRKRQSGTRFWNACQRCEEMLGLLGVPVVRAKAEGEALCALLNQQGIVDGVISNDGDCLLYGAKVLYTKFTLENLEKSRVMRYDITDIRACVDDDDSDEYDRKGVSESQQESREIVHLNRNDLIAFAILTGSDIVGDGFPKVGCRKAIRFIKKCQMDNPLKPQEAAIHELKSWGKIAEATRRHNNFEADDTPEDDKPTRYCSCCCHPGTKATHKKYGCKQCGTEPGEACFSVSPGRRFRSSLKTKALAMNPTFDPQLIFSAYHLPNDNQVPLVLHSESARTLQMSYPSLQQILQSKFIIRGHSFAESREYLRQSLSCLLARIELFNGMMREQGNIHDSQKKVPSNYTRPQPKKIQKGMVCRGSPSYEVVWLVKATVTDIKGNPINEFQFSTIEGQEMVKKCYPRLVEEFEEEENEKTNQGTAEQEKRRVFLNLMCGITDPNQQKKEKRKRLKFAGRYFRDEQPSGTDIPSKMSRQEHKVTKLAKHKRPSEIAVPHNDNDFNIHQNLKRSSSLDEKGDLLASKSTFWGDDADQLLRFVQGKKKDQGEKNNDDLSTIDTWNPCSESSVSSIEQQKHVTRTVCHSEYAPLPLTPGHIHFLEFRGEQESRESLQSCTIKLVDKFSAVHAKESSGRQDLCPHKGGSLEPKMPKDLDNRNLLSRESPKVSECQSLQTLKFAIEGWVPGRTEAHFQPLSEEQEYLNPSLKDPSTFSEMQSQVNRFPNDNAFKMAPCRDLKTVESFFPVAKRKREEKLSRYPRCLLQDQTNVFGDTVRNKHQPHAVEFLEALVKDCQLSEYRRNDYDDFLVDVSYPYCLMDSNSDEIGYIRVGPKRSRTLQSFEKTSIQVPADIQSNSSFKPPLFDDRYYDLAADINASWNSFDFKEMNPSCQKAIRDLKVSFECNSEVSLGIIKSATQKLEKKMRQANLDFECSRELVGHFVNCRVLF